LKVTLNAVGGFHLPKIPLYAFPVIIYELPHLIDGNGGNLVFRSDGAPRRVAAFALFVTCHVCTVIYLLISVNVRLSDEKYLSPVNFIHLPVAMSGSIRPMGLPSDDKKHGTDNYGGHRNKVDQINVTHNGRFLSEYCGVN